MIKYVIIGFVIGFLIWVINFLMIIINIMKPI